MEHLINNLNQSKLNVSELSKILKNVSKNYLRLDSLSKFNEYKKYIQIHGLESIDAIRPVLPKIDRQAARIEIFAVVSRLSLEHPCWGSERLSEELKTQQIDISASAIYNILVKHQLGTKNERLLKLEEKFSENIHELSPEQIAALEKFDPGFKERQIRGKKPGELLAQDTIFIGFLNGGDEIYLQVIVDSFSSYAFGLIHIGKTPDYAVAIIHNDVLPFFKKYQLPVLAIFTDNGLEYCGKEGHHYELYLRLNDIEHVKTKTKQCSNSFIKQFKKIVMDDFLKKVESGKAIESIETIQVELEQWLYYYNNQRPYHGYPNNGKPPIKLITKQN